MARGWGWTVLLGALVATAGCGSTSGARASAPPPSGRVLRAEEIRSVAVLTAYQAIARLRPQWFRGRRGQSSIQSPGSAQVVVYIDGVRVGGAAELERVQAIAVVEAEYLSGPEATTRFGMGHGGGAILVRTR